MGLEILAIDDSRTIRDMLKLTLEAAGHKAVVAIDGEDGLRALEDLLSAKGPPDAVITDINMPKLDGFGVIEKVRSKSETKMVTILVLSTESSDVLKARAREAGATGWIVKPFEPSRLLQAIETVAC